MILRTSGPAVTGAGAVCYAAHFKITTFSTMRGHAAFTGVRLLHYTYCISKCSASVGSQRPLPRHCMGPHPERRRRTKRGWTDGEMSRRRPDSERDVDVIVAKLLDTRKPRALVFKMRLCGDLLGHQFGKTLNRRSAAHVSAPAAAAPRIASMCHSPKSTNQYRLRGWNELIPAALHSGAELLREQCPTHGTMTASDMSGGWE